MLRTVLAAAAALACVQAQESPRDLARSILQELIEIDTTDSAGDNTAAAEAMARRFRAAGFADGDVQVVVPAAKKGNLVVRFRGTGKARPVLFLGHLDVVEARRSDWTIDPFRLTEKDGYLYGRGTSDMKGDDALLVANFLRLKREGFAPERDLILALTADEEGGRGPNGAEWLLRNRRELIDAALCINMDGGGGHATAGHRTLYSVQAAEKGYLSFVLRAKNPGGHSSLPERENAIYDLAAALLRVRDLKFPVHLNEVTRAFFEQTAKMPGMKDAADRLAILKSPPDPQAETRLSAKPFENALLHTTCVATMLAGGHADNALPQTAEATVNCRLLPGETQAHVEERIREAAGPKIEVRVKIPAAPNPASPLSLPLMSAVRGVVESMWPGMPVLPVMDTGGTDGKPLRGAGIPTYGISQMFGDLDDVRAHGQDERIRTAYFHDGLDFGYKLLKALGRAF